MSKTASLTSDGIKTADFKMWKGQEQPAAHMCRRLLVLGYSSACTGQNKKNLLNVNINAMCKGKSHKDSDASKIKHFCRKETLIVKDTGVFPCVVLTWFQHFSRFLPELFGHIKISPSAEI